MNTKFYVTLSQAMRLKELGVVQQSEAFWENGELENHHMYTHGAPINPVAAYSVGELLSMLPQDWHLWRVEDDDTYSGIEWRCSDDYCSLLYYKGNDLAASALFYTIIEESKHNPAFSIEAINARYLEAIGE